MVPAVLFCQTPEVSKSILFGCFRHHCRIKLKLTNLIKYGSVPSVIAIEEKREHEIVMFIHQDNYIST